MIRKIPMKTRLIVGLMISALIPTLVISFVSYSITRAEMKDQVFRQLESMRNIKKEQIYNQDSLVTEQVFSKNPNQFDLMILPLNISHLKGFEHIERIFKMQANIPIILTTGYVELIDMQKIEKLGFHSLLLKPYNLNDISHLIAEILKS